MNRILVLLLAVLFSGLLRGAPVVVFVSIPTGLEPVVEIGGNAIEARSLLTTSGSPESFHPDARTLSALGRSRLFISIGAPYEAALLPKLRSAYPGLEIADGAQGMSHRTFPDGGEDPHVWLSAENMLCYSENVAAALSRILPEKADYFKENLDRYCGKLRGVHEGNLRRLAFLRGGTVLVYHPAFGYFLGEHGIEQLAIEEEGKEPTGGSLQASMRRARERGLPAIFVQPRFSERSARILAKELKCRVISLDPLPSSLVEGLSAIGEAIEKAYRPVEK